MNKKRIISLLLVLCMAFVFSSCQSIGSLYGKQTNSSSKDNSADGRSIKQDDGTGVAEEVPAEEVTPAETQVEEKIEEPKETPKEEPEKKPEKKAEEKPKEEPKEKPAPKKNIAEAKWNGYGGASLKRVLEKGLPKVVDPESAELKATVTIMDGWNGTGRLNAGTDVAKGCKAVTYRAVVSDTQMAMEIVFFMEYDENKNSLSVKGAKATMGVETNEVGSAEAAETLNEIVSMAG